MTKKYFFSPRVLLPSYKYMEFHSKQNPKGNLGFFTTPYYAAKYSKHGVMVARLGNMMKKDTVNLLNQDGKTAAIRAVEWDGGNIRAVQGLLSITSVDFNIPDKDGRSLLDIAR